MVRANSEINMIQPGTPQSAFLTGVGGKSPWLPQLYLCTSSGFVVKLQQPVTNDSDACTCSEKIQVFLRSQSARYSVDGLFLRQELRGFKTK